jgi:DNA helicase II / ATP-dependent DNA helicase PcrA
LSLAEQLNPEQVAAVTHGEGPQLVLAGAGTGKTRVITHRIAWLVREQSVEPYRIAAVTFTNKAASEMRERVERLLGGGSEVFLGTFHRFSLRLLRRYGEAVGLRRDFTILDTDEQIGVVKEALELEHLDPSVFQPRSVLSAISGAKNRLLSVAELEAEASGFWQTRVADAYRSYQRLLREAGAVDFDDMIALAVKLLENEAELGERMRRRLRFLMVDEFQDTNFAQLRLIETLCGSAGNLTAVGDEDQSIYRWRGAELGNILEFEDRFPGAVVRKLERNYRSTQAILDASGALVSHNVQRRGKKLWTESSGGDELVLYRGRDEIDEASWMVARLRQLHVSGLSRYRQSAVLLRTNAQTRSIEEELIRQQVPYRLVAGTRFYERAEVKDLIAYLRVVRNPRDNLSLRRILNQPPRGIGKATLELLFREAEEMGRSLWEVLRLERFDGAPARGARGLRELRDLVLELHEQARELDLGSLLERILVRTGYADLYRKEDSESQARLENVEELLSAAREFSEEQPGPALRAPSDEGVVEEGGELLGDSGDPLTAFLDYAALVSDTDTLETEAGVSLMTLHSAKGLEFETVFLAGLEEGLLPHYNTDTDEQLEEERRLLYVGMTRAKRRLLLSTCRRRRIAGRFQDQNESRFLGELPEELLRVEGGAAYQPGEPAGVYEYFGRRRSAMAPQPAPVLRAPSQPSLQRTPSRAGRPPLLTGPQPGALGIDLVKGKGVRHPLLGPGVILDVEGDGENAKLTVYFDKAGKRRLIVKYAGLEPL